MCKFWREDFLQNTMKPLDVVICFFKEWSNSSICVLQFFPASRFFLLNHDLFFVSPFFPPQTKKKSQLFVSLNEEPWWTSKAPGWFSWSHWRFQCCLETGTPKYHGLKFPWWLQAYAWWLWWGHGWFVTGIDLVDSFGWFLKAGWGWTSKGWDRWFCGICFGTQVWFAKNERDEIWR